MLKVLFGDYIKNIWYNLISIVIISASILAFTFFLSNLTAQTRMYRLISSHLGEENLMMHMKWMNFDDSQLVGVEDSFMTKEISCYSDKISNIESFAIYDDEVMDLLKPRLSMGRYIQSGNENEIEVLAGDAGFRIGDTFELYFCDAKTGDWEPFTIKIVGIISEGQKLFMGASYKKTLSDFSDLYMTYSYEQLKKAVFITTEEQMNKVDKELSYINMVCIYKMKDDVSDEVMNENMLKIADYEMEMFGSTTMSSIPSTDELTEGMESKVQKVLLKYIPLTVGLIVLAVICITGIVTVKTTKSMRYYAIMHICGMNSKKAVYLAGGEMLINNVLSVMLSVSIIVLQKQVGILGTINCELGIWQGFTMVIFCLSIIGMTMFMTYGTLKEKTVMDILKDTAY